MVPCALCGDGGADFLCFALCDWICAACCAAHQRRIFPIVKVTLHREGPRFERGSTALGTGIAKNPFARRECPQFCPHLLNHGCGSKTG